MCRTCHHSFLIPYKVDWIVFRSRWQWKKVTPTPMGRGDWNWGWLSNQWLLWGWWSSMVRLYQFLIQLSNLASLSVWRVFSWPFPLPPAFHDVKSLNIQVKITQCAGCAQIWIFLILISYFLIICGLTDPVKLFRLILNLGPKLGTVPFRTSAIGARVGEKSICKAVSRQPSAKCHYNWMG